MSVDSKQVASFVEKEWKDHVLKTLEEYITIPNQSPAFDPEVLTNGLQDKAVNLFVAWVKAQNVAGLSLKVVQEPKRTPLLFIEVKGTADSKETVLLYGHLDKQPPMTEFWAEGLGPWKPVLKEGKLYGRGGADDGYAVFAAILAIKALQEQKVGHARCVVAIEACEESGSPDLPFYVKSLAQEIGTPSLVVCLDSGCGNYDQMWLTTSLRGMLIGTLKVKILNEAVHSGMASGVIPSSFRILRQVMDRIEDSKDGKLFAECYTKIPDKHLAYAQKAAEALGTSIHTSFPLVKGARVVTDDLAQLLLNRTWRPTLCVTGMDGIPAQKDAGNVLRTETSVKLSIRLPPTADPAAVCTAMKKLCEENPPYGAEVTYTPVPANAGWCAPELESWLETSINNASSTFFNKPSVCWGEGGSIPFMGMLGAQFPKTQFVVTGVLGPKSNAHGPNEFLHVDMAKKLTGCVSMILADHYAFKVKTPST